jgi:hypothetical protein
MAVLTPQQYADQLQEQGINPQAWRDLNGVDEECINKADFSNHRKLKWAVAEKYKDDAVTYAYCKNWITTQ